MLSVALCLVLALTIAVSASSTSPKTLVLLDTMSYKESHSLFFADLTNQGHELFFNHAYDEEIKPLKDYGEYAYDNLVIIAPSAEMFGVDITVDDIVDFVDSGRNLILMVGDGSGYISEPVRLIANELGIELGADKTHVVDHFSFDLASATSSTSQVDHKKVVIPAASINTPIVKGLQLPVHYKGVTHSSISDTASPNRVITHVLRGNPTTYTAGSGAEETEQAGVESLLITGIQSKNNARIVVSGSIDVFGNQFFASAQAANREFSHELIMWCFKGKGQLRATQLTHYKLAEDDRNDPRRTKNPSRYRVEDEIMFSVLVEEYDSMQQKWVPFQAEDMQLELKMIDPWYRLNLEHDGNGLFFKQFKVPDVYGVYQFIVNYHRHGYTSIELHQHVSITPYRHNQFERFIPAAYPYYASVFSVMSAFFVFGLLFLYTK